MGGAPFDKADQEHILNLYDGGVQYADYTVETILRHLKALDLLDNTIVVISSDHGEILGTDGKTLGHPADALTDEVFDVPLIIAGPGLPSGLRIPQRSENVDIVPTLVELLQFEHEAQFDGHSLVPLIVGKQQGEIRSYLYSKSAPKLFGGEPLHIVRKDEAKYIFENAAGPPTPRSRDELVATMQHFAMPDTVARRQPSLKSIEQGKGAAEFLIERIQPGWTRYSALATDNPPMFQIPHSDGFIKEVWTEELDPTDGLWTRVFKGNDYTHSTSVIYVAFNDTETAPRMANLRKIKPGNYRVSILASTFAADGVQRASSFRVNTKNPEEFQLLRLEPESTEQRTMRWMDIGDVDVSGGTFYFHIEPGDVSAFAGFRFQDMTQEQDPDLDFEQITEELETLGYLN
ncbi:MAG: sulfatase-like hydrolase/transferase [Candidatus Hydrogenedentota bacterium]